MVFAWVFTAFYGKNKISEGEAVEPTEYKGIITVWQVDSFEGGRGSRKQFLLKVAREFEKSNPGVLVMVINYTADGVRESQSKGVFPDVISFGGGVDVSGFSMLNFSVDFKGGKVGNSDYAIPWCRGGYVLIENPKLSGGEGEEIDTLLVSEGEYTQPLIALLQEGIRANEYDVRSPMDAYVKFVSGKTRYFLGTQRDLIRLSNRGMEVKITPLTQFNDLVQYAVITSSEEIKRYYAEEFLRFLTSEKIQQTVYEIGMFSAISSAITDNEHGASMQKASGFSTISAFTASAELKDLQGVAKRALFGDAEAINKIKNILVLP